MDETPISLYLDLEPGEIADIETVSRAAIAFSAAIREAAFMIDPTLEIKIGFVSGTEGSLSLNSILKNIKFKNEKGEVLTLKALAVVIGRWFAHHGMDWTYEEVMDHVFHHEKVAEGFTDEQKKELVHIVSAAVDKKVAQPEVQRVYRELEKDPAVKGVGITHTAGEKPKTIVPRTSFPVRGGYIFHEEHVIQRRVRTDQRRLILISPVLLPGTKRRWRFMTENDSEIGAPILDQSFVDDVASGKVRIPMRSGIELDVELETTEELRDGVWEIVDRKILSVSKTYPRNEQPNLPFSGNQDQTTNDNGKK